MTSFAPNYMVRTLLSHPKFAEEIAILQRSHLLSTPEGRQDAMRQKYPDFNVTRNDFDPKQSTLLFDIIERHLAGAPISQMDEFRQKYDCCINFFSCASNGCFYSIPGGGQGQYALIARAQNQTFIFVSRKKNFTK